MKNKILEAQVDNCFTLTKNILTSKNTSSKNYLRDMMSGHMCLSMILSLNHRWKEENSQLVFLLQKGKKSVNLL